MSSKGSSDCYLCLGKTQKFASLCNMRLRVTLKLQSCKISSVHDIHVAVINY